MIKRLYLIFDKNVFIANEVFYIRSEIAGKKTCLPDVLKDYLKIGEALKDEDSVKNLKNDLARLRTSGNDSCAYYAAIIGPSFLGKTQTAFTLSHVMNVIYVNLLAADIAVQGSDGSLSQPIYNHFEDFSNLFYQTIDQDLKETKTNTSQSISSNNSGYQTLGLLYCLIRRKYLNPDKNESVEERFLHMLNIKTALVPKLNVLQFKHKMAGKINR